MVSAIIYMIGGLIEALIGLRFLFQLLGANPASGFVHMVYDLSTPFVAPFAGIFGQGASVAGQGVVTASVFDWTALIAFVVYAIVLSLVGRAFVHRSNLVHHS